MTTGDEAAEAFLREHDARQLDQLREFLRIPSVSGLPEHAGDVRRAAEWVADRLRALGAQDVALLPTEGHPVVFGAWLAPEGAPTAILYGHYDVQPPDPLELWETPPFEPTIRDGRLYARGASDDKGNMFAPLAAIEALLATGGLLSIGITCLVDGEEEIGSPGLTAFVRENKERLRADFALCADDEMWGPDQPSLTIAAKGIAAAQIDLRTANTDLHSGEHGLTVPNAVEALARLVTTLHDAAGRIAIDGFYDPVRDLTGEERAQIAAVPFDEDEYRRGLELPALWGEPEYTALERRWARPSLDLDGIWGGFQGEGLKTVTPCEAHAKITCRLVPDQEPGKVLDLIEAHLREHCPPGATVALRHRGSATRPFAIAPDHPALLAAGRVLRDLYGKEPLIARSGGTLPLAETLQRELGVDMVFFSWGLPGDNAHAPNESYSLAAFATARRAYCAILPELARAYGGSQVGGRGPQVDRAGR